jgi:redox-regulated HSP33 family molecular chaperone
LSDPFSQVGKGYFALLIDQGEGTKPYQGITPLAGGSLSACAETYFAQSEQLPTRFALSHGRSQVPGEGATWRAGGVMLQHMPKASPGARDAPSGHDGLLGAFDMLDGDEGENWTRANVLLDTVEELELIGPSVQPTELLVRLFHEEQPRVFDPQPVVFGCSCSEDKVRQSLSIYSAKDIRYMTTAENTVTADCQFCGAHYVLDPLTVGFQAERAPGDPVTPNRKGRMTRPAEVDRVARALALPGDLSSDFDLNPAILLPEGRVLRAAGVLCALQQGRAASTSSSPNAPRNSNTTLARSPSPAGGKTPAIPIPSPPPCARRKRRSACPPPSSRVIGTLPTHETVTGFVVTPVIGWVREPFAARAEAGEVAEIFRLPLAHLLNSANFRVEGRRWQGRKRYYYTVPYGPYYIWGATARMLRALAERVAR